MMRFLTSAAVLALAACSSVPTATDGSELSLLGCVSLADRAGAAENIRVTVNGKRFKTGADGCFTAPVAEADIYALTFTGQAVFDSVHTFSHQELDKGSNALKIPNITLVEKKPGRRLLTFGGDAMMGRRYIEPRWDEPQLIHDRTRLADMKAVLAEMKPYFEPADYASVNLETILAKTEPLEHAPKSVVFYTHPDITKALEWMGTDYVSLGNNHTYDYLDDGLETTLEALKSSALDYSGAGVNEADATRPFVADLDGVPVATWGYVGWKGRVMPHQVAEGEKGGAAYGDEATIRRSLKAGVKPGQIDIVQYHGSREYSEGPSESTETRLKLAIDEGADLVIAHHPHVSQGFELYKDKLIAWSLGNFAFDQFFYSTHAAAALNVWMDGDNFYRAEIIPLHVKGYKPLPATGRVRDYMLDRAARLSGERGTIISRSGGHGVIDADQSEPALMPSGHEDILFVGDFENYDHFNTQDRSWFAENATLETVAHGPTGTQALKITPIDPNRPVRFGPKTFMRVFPTDEMEWKAVISAPAGTTVTADVQYRPKGMNRYKALKEAKFQTIGNLSVAKSGPIPLAFNFDAPSWKSHPSRMVLTFEKAGGPILIDNIDIVPVGTPHKGIKK